jgi:hypothetical protein
MRLLIILLAFMVLGACDETRELPPDTIHVHDHLCEVNGGVSVYVMSCENNRLVCEHYSLECKNGAYFKTYKREAGK